MIRKLIRRIKLFVQPVELQQVYLGDVGDFDFKAMEQALHGLRDLSGNLKHHHWVGPETYRITIEEVLGTYYRCKSEVLTRDVNDGKFVWKSRTNVRRIDRNHFRYMIVEGKLKKQ